MRQTLHAVVLALGVGACVDVPDSVHAHFAPPAASERTNYRPGRHGSAPAVEDPPLPVPKALDSAATDSAATDAGATPEAATTTPTDGGAP